MFLNPLLLFGGAAISVPIIIHLLNRRKFERVVWAAMRFLRVSVEQNQRRLRIEDLLLLLLRCLIVCLLALTLARPVVNHANLIGLGADRVTAAVILDNSASMSQADGGASRFDQGKKAIDSIIDSFPRGSSSAFLLASNIADPVIAEPTIELATVREQVSKAVVTDRSTDLLPAIQKAIAILKDQPNPHKEIYLVTDGQALGWQQTTDIQRLLVEHKDDVKVNIIFLGETDQSNLGISDLRMTGNIAIVNRPLRFEVQVTNYGLTDARNVPVRIAMDNDAPSEETSIDLIPVGESRSVSMFSRFKTDGLHNVTAKLTPDRVPADDSRSIVVRCLKKVDVLLVDGHPGETRQDSETYLLQEALQPVGFMDRDQWYVQVKTMSPADLDPARLEEFDAIVLADVPEFTPKVVNKFVAYLRQGGGLIFFPGNQTNLAFYNDELYRHRGILPAGIGAARGDEAQSTKFLTFQSDKYEHPIVSRWNDKGAGRLEKAQFFKWFNLDITPHQVLEDPVGTTDPVKPSEPGPTQTILKYNDGEPAVVEHAWGNGRVILFSSTASTHWNDLAANPPIFIPLIYNCISAVLQRGDDFMNIRVGQNFVFHPPADLLGHDASISSSSGAHIDTRKIVLQDDKPTLTYDATDFAGVYTVEFPGTSGTPFKFAAQMDPRESRLDPLPADQLASLGQDANVVKVKSGEPLNWVVTNLATTTEIWKYPAIMLLLLAITEFLVAQWFSQSK